MKNYSIAFLLIFLVAITCQAQQYYVKLNGDTIYGKANLNPILDNSRTIKFVTSTGEKVTLKPHLTKVVYYSDDHVFKPVIYNNQRFFMILMEGGPLSAYRFISKSGSTTQISRVLSKEGKSIEVNKFNFKNQMTNFLDDCPQVVTGLEEKKYRLRDLAAMVKAYNNCTSETSNLATSHNQQEPTITTTTEPATQATEPVVETPVVEPKQPISEAVETTSEAKPQTLSDTSVATNHIEVFRNHVADTEGLSNKTDILELIKDLENRWQQEGVVPGYLWGALENMTKSDAGLIEKVRELKDNLIKE